jgi:hypothetical protein
MSTPVNNTVRKAPITKLLVPRPTWLDLSPEGATLGDLVGEVLVKVRLRWAIVLAFLVHGGLLIYELIVSFQFSTDGTSTITLFDPEEYIHSLLSYFFYGPLVWAFFVWQPVVISAVFRTLLSDGFIGRARRERVVKSVFKHPTWRRRIVVTGILISLYCFAIFIYAWVYPPPCGTGFASCFGRSEGWLTRSDWFFKWVWTPVFALDLYMLTMILVRQICLVWMFFQLFRSYELRPKLYHPDECSGLAFAGRFFIWTAWYVAIMSAWILFVLTYPMFWRFPPNFPPYNLYYVAGMALGLPMLGLLPMYFVYQAMQRARDDHLKSLAHQLPTEIPRTPHELHEAVARLDVYAHIDKAHVVVPFPRRRMVLFLLTAFIPSVLGAIALTVQIIQAIVPKTP